MSKVIRDLLRQHPQCKLDISFYLHCISSNSSHCTSTSTSLFNRGLSHLHPFINSLRHISHVHGHLLNTHAHLHPSYHTCHDHHPSSLSSNVAASSLLKELAIDNSFALAPSNVVKCYDVANVFALSKVHHSRKLMRLQSSNTDMNTPLPNRFIRSSLHVLSSVSDAVIYCFSILALYLFTLWDLINHMGHNSNIAGVYVPKSSQIHVFCEVRNQGFRGVVRYILHSFSLAHKPSTFSMVLIPGLLISPYHFLQVEQPLGLPRGRASKLNSHFSKMTLIPRLRAYVKPSSTAILLSIFLPSKRSCFFFVTPSIASYSTHTFSKDIIDSSQHMAYFSQALFSLIFFWLTELQSQFGFTF